MNTLQDQLRNGQVVAAGVYDCLSASIAESAGFKALALSGAGVAASAAGVPDMGLLSFGELLHTTRNVCAISSVPVIVDADTGFGNELNVMRTCELLAAAGAAAIMLEDQVAPKRCGHLEGKAVVSAEEFVSKIRAARLALEGTGVALIARTDALAVHGLDDAVLRCKLASEAGADITFIEAPTSDEVVRVIGEQTPGSRLYNLATGGRSPSYKFDELQALGFNLIVIPGIALAPVVRGIQDAAAAVLAAGSDEPLLAYGLPPRGIFESVGLSRWLEREAQVVGHA